MQSTDHDTPGATGEKTSLDNFLLEGMRYFQGQKQLQRKEAVWKNIKMACWVVFFGGIVLFQLVFYRNMLGADSGPTNAAVAMIPIEGAIGEEYQASADKVVPLIEKACKNEGVETVVLKINSPGGAPTESERIVAAMEICRKEHHKKFIALIDGLGASAAYMVAMHADQIMANRYAVVGSIGAIMRYVDASTAAAKIGLRERVFKSGLVKGGPSMLSPSDEKMDAINQEMVATLGQDFLNEVYVQRKGKLTAPKEEIFTGRVWTAPQAKALGLIDRVATIEELKATDFKDKKVREYKPATPFAEGLGLTKALTGAVKGALMELDRPAFE